MASILIDSRIVTEVAVSNSASTHSASLIVDTGAELSAFPVCRLPSALKPTGPVIKMRVGGSTISTFLVRGTTAEIAVEPAGGGVETVKRVKLALRVHYLSLPAGPFVNFDGILGMDLLDTFQVDAAKNRGGTHAYLAERA
jgi:hypothetical protein